VHRYPHRLLFELQLPEPGRWLRQVVEHNSRDNVEAPRPFTKNGKPVVWDTQSPNPPLSAADLDTDKTVREIAARYGAMGIPPRPTYRVVSGILSVVTPDTAKETEYAHVKTNETTGTIGVPDGFKAVSWKGSVLAFTPIPPSDQGHFAEPHIYASVGGGGPIEVSALKDARAVVADVFPATRIAGDRPRPHYLQPLDTGSIPITVLAIGCYEFAVAIQVDCSPTDEAIMEWQQRVHDLLYSAYRATVRDYEDAREAASARRRERGLSPAKAAALVRLELKRQVQEMLSGKPFTGLDLPTYDPAAKPPTVTVDSLVASMESAPEVQFLESAFEWHNLTYVLYGHHWAHKDRWQDLMLTDTGDPALDEFLSAGSVRVVLPAAPALAAQAWLYAYTGVIWGDGPVPGPGQAGYTTVAHEVLANINPAEDGEIVSVTPRTVPTSLIWLDDGNALPENTANPYLRYVDAHQESQPPTPSVQDRRD